MSMIVFKKKNYNEKILLYMSHVNVYIQVCTYTHIHTLLIYIEVYKHGAKTGREKVIKSWGEGWVCVWNTGQEDKCIYAINKCIHLCNKIIKVPTIRNGFNYQMVSL